MDSKQLIEERKSPLALGFTTIGNEKDKSQRVDLYPNQVDHFQRAQEIMAKSYFFVDTSVPGSGKTWIQSALSIYNDLDVLVICPRTVRATWFDCQNRSKMRLIDAITYEGLRSTKGHQPKHGYLVRTEDNEFLPTEKLIALIRKGVLIAIDEFQKIKNKSVQRVAVEALIRAVSSTKTRSRVSLLSGSPFDKEIHSVNLMHTLGYIKSQKLYSYNPQTGYRREGMQELIDVVFKMNPMATSNVLKANGFNQMNLAKQSKDSKHVAFLLFLEVIKPTIVASMPPPFISAQLDVQNGYYWIEEEENRLNLCRAIDKLSRAVHYNRERDDVEIDQFNSQTLGAINVALRDMELSKLPIFVRQAREQLTKNPKSKVILFVNYVDSYKILVESLDEFKPRLMAGQTSDKERMEILTGFQNDPKLRLLVSNTKVGGIGTNLHDEKGDEPRFSFISPSYALLDILQATMRTYRVGTKSKSTSRLVYGLCDHIEASILSALARKIGVLKSILDERVTDTLQYPDQFQADIEIKEFKEKDLAETYRAFVNEILDQFERTKKRQAILNGVESEPESEAEEKNPT